MLTCDRSQVLHYLDTETGKRYPSVSQCLDVLYGDRFRHVDSAVLAEAQARGMRRHLLFGLLLLWRDGLAERPLIEPQDERVAGGLMDWIHRNNVKPLKVEDSAVSERYGFAGTPDTLCLYGPKRTVMLCDLKTGAPHDAYKIQVEAYWRLPEYDAAQVLTDVFVDDAGTVREDRVTPSPHNWAAFLNAIQLLKWRQRAA